MKKYLFLFFSVLTLSIFSFAFTSCSDDDDDNSGSVWTTAELIGTTWKGTNSQNKYTYQLTIKTTTACEFKLYSPSGELVETSTLPFTYNETTGAFTSTYYSETISGTISGNSMTFTTQGATVKMTKQ